MRIQHLHFIGTDPITGKVLQGQLVHQVVAAITAPDWGQVVLDAHYEWRQLHWPASRCGRTELRGIRSARSDVVRCCLCYDRMERRTNRHRAERKADGSRYAGRLTALQNERRRPSQWRSRWVSGDQGCSISTSVVTAS